MLLTNKIEYCFNQSIKILDFSLPNKKYIQSIPYWIKKLRKYFRKNPDRTIISFFVKINIISLISLLFYKNKIIVSERSDPLF